MINVVGIQQGRITIFDATGRVVKEQFISGDEIDVSYLPMGIYFIQISSQGELFSERILKSSN